MIKLEDLLNEKRSRKANPNQSRIGAPWMDCVFNISFVATGQEILSTRPDSPAGEVVIAYGSDTFKLYVYYQGVWYIYNDPSRIPFNINFQGTQQEILAAQPTNPSGEVTVAYGTDTNHIYVYYQGIWYIIYNGGQVPFNINFQGTQQEILATRPTNPSGEATVAYGTDTNNIYVYYQGLWYVVRNNTSETPLSVQWFEENEQGDLVLRSGSIESTNPAIEIWEEVNSTDYSPRETGYETSETGIQYFEQTGEDVIPRIKPLDISGEPSSVQWFEKNEQGDLVLRPSPIESMDPAIEIWEVVNSTDYSPREADYETSEEGIQYFEQTGEDVIPRIDPLI